jgi:hypothetical protein
MNMDTSSRAGEWKAYYSSIHIHNLASDNNKVLRRVHLPRTTHGNPKCSTQYSVINIKINTARPRTLQSLVKAYIAQAPHLPPHAKSTRLGAHNLSSEPNKHTNSIMHNEFLMHAERSYDSNVDALECRCIWHARAACA